ncbi:MAG TPA: outer membrane beta-barrel protein [Vicinamibacterales bacterium]|nr:outer membrane beta-barrel protein [Vicinamibacterales bacterium]
MSAWAGGAAAQSTPGAPEGGLVLGPVAARPRADLTIGVDGNVFNEAANPKSDTMLTFVPSVELRMRFGRLNVSGTTQTAVAYFHKYANQRSVNPAQDATFELPLSRVTARGFFTAASIRERPSLEIDLRARRLVHAYGLGGDIHLLAKTVVRVQASRAATDYEGDAVFLHTNLRQALSVRNTAAAASIRHALTPLTTAVVQGEWLNDEFRFDASRNARSVRIMSGLEFSRFALVSGVATAGYRRFVPSSPDVPEYRGFVAAVDVSTVVRGATRVALRASRDVAYSFDVRHPYYVQTDVALSITQRIRENWDAVASGSWQRLRYRASRAAFAEAAGEPTLGSEPRAIGIGAGIGYRLSGGLRVGVEGRRLRRLSGSPNLDYDGWQLGSTFAYDF